MTTTNNSDDEEEETSEDDDSDHSNDGSDSHRSASTCSSQLRMKTVERALIASLVLHQRLQEICSDFEDYDGEASICDNGCSSMERDGTEVLVGSLCLETPNSMDQMKGSELQQLIEELVQ